VNEVLLHPHLMFLPPDEKQELHLVHQHRMIFAMPAKLQYCVYVLLSLKDNLFYIGFTTDLKRRLTEHFHGQSAATAPRLPFRLIFCEYYLSETDARRREDYFKTTAGKRALKLMLVDTLNQTKGGS